MMHSGKQISYNTMESLLNGSIKKQKDLKTAFNEVTIFYKEVGDDMLIDCFFCKCGKVRL